MTPTEKRDLQSKIEAIIVENARLLGEPARLGVQRLPKGWVRIRWTDENGKFIRGDHREYRDMQVAYEAALISNENAKKLARRDARRRDRFGLGAKS